MLSPLKINVKTMFLVLFTSACCVCRFVVCDKCLTNRFHLLSVRLLLSGTQRDVQIQFESDPFGLGAIIVILDRRSCSAVGSDHDYRSN